MRLNRTTTLWISALSLGLFFAPISSNASSCYKMSQGVCKQSSFGTLDSTCQYDCKVALTQHGARSPVHKKKALLPHS
jgi:hypothetical protein